MERFEESAFCREIEAFRLPRYADLPDFRLYIDQLIALVEKTLAPLMGADGEKWITATMVGNYARQGVIPRPEGKRYGREHAAYLIFVCLSKQVIAIGDIQQLIALQRRTEFNVAVAYDYFCTELESILAHVFNARRYGPIPAARMRGRPIWYVRQGLRWRTRFICRNTCATCAHRRAKRSRQAADREEAGGRLRFAAHPAGVLGELLKILCCNGCRERPKGAENGI